MKMEANKLVNRVEDHDERAQETNRSPVDNCPNNDENNLTLTSIESGTIKDAQEAQSNDASVMSEVWAQILLQEELDDQQLFEQEQVANKSSNTDEHVEKPEEGVDVSIKEKRDPNKEKVNFEPDKETLLITSPTSSRFKDCSFSETSVQQEATSADIPPQLVKSETVEKSPTEEFSFNKPDFTVQDKEICGLLENRYDVTTEIMAIIENEVLYHIFPVQVIVDPGYDIDRRATSESIQSSSSVASNQSNQNKSKESNTTNRETSESSSSFTSTTSACRKESENPAGLSAGLSAENDDVSQTTIDTYMHYMYGKELTPRKKKSEFSYNCARQDSMFVVSGEELLPQFQIESQPQLNDQDIGKKISQNSFSSETTDLSSDLDDESKEVLILDLAIDAGRSNRDALYTEIDSNREEVEKNMIRSSVSDTTSRCNLSKTPRSSKSGKKSKTPRSTNKKVKKFFCFT